jgi:phage-related protein (TIGR01555 family)
LPGVRPAKLPSASEVVLALDSAGNQEPMATDAMPASWGYTGNGTLGPGLAFLGFPYLAELTQISEYRIPAETLSTEMTRTWVKLKNKGKKKLDDKIAEITQAFEDFKLRDVFREAALKTEEFGRAHVAINIKGQDSDITRQLPLTKIQKGTLLGFKCIEPYWLTPYSWNSTRPRDADFYKPQSWFEMGKKTHASRYLTFIFREVPDLLKPAYDFAGISITQLMMPYVQRWLRTAKNVNDLINIFSIVTLATDLQTMLQAPDDSPESLMGRLRAFTAARDNRGAMVINKDTEELSVNDVSLGSLDKLQAQSQEHMATPARMPLIKFFGITPTGLNATSEGEFQSWYDYVKSLQVLGYGPHLERALELVQMHLYGEVDPDITYEFLSLYEPTPKEEGEMRKADAERDSVYLDKSVVSPDEVREKLRIDPKSGYGDLEGDAPPPPEQAEFELGEKGAESAHGRSEESAENAHERQLEIQTTEGE